MYIKHFYSKCRECVSITNYLSSDVQIAVTLGHAGFWSRTTLQRTMKDITEQSVYIKNTYNDNKTNTLRNSPVRKHWDTNLLSHTKTQYHTSLTIKFPGLYCACWYTSAWTSPHDNQYAGHAYPDMPRKTRAWKSFGTLSKSHIRLQSSPIET